MLAQYSDTDVVNYQDRNGQTPLHWACEKEYVSCVKAVLVFYPNLTLKDKDGNVPMAIARKHGNEEVKKELQRYGITFCVFSFFFFYKKKIFI